MEELGKLIFSETEGRKTPLAIKRKDEVFINFWSDIPMKFYGGTVFREITDDKVTIVIKK